MKNLLAILFSVVPVCVFAQGVTWTETLTFGSNVPQNDTHFEVCNVSESAVTVTRPSGTHSWTRFVSGDTDSPASPNSYWGYLTTLGSSAACTMNWSAASISIPTLNYYHYGHIWNDRTITDLWDRADTHITGGTTHTYLSRTGTGLNGVPEVDEFTKPYVTSGGGGGGSN